MDVLVTYDISTVTTNGEQRQARVAAVCERYGSRVQYSVFECRVSPVRFEQLITELMDEIDPKVDSVRIYRFAGAIVESCVTIGKPASRALGDPWII